MIKKNEQTEPAQKQNRYATTMWDGGQQWRSPKMNVIEMSTGNGSPLLDMRAANNFVYRFCLIDWNSLYYYAVFKN